jgi:hypothetical protein
MPHLCGGWLAGVAAPHEEGAVTSLVEPPRAPDLAPQRERLLELGLTWGHASALQRVCSITRRTQLMRSQGCQRRTSVSLTRFTAANCSDSSRHELRERGGCHSCLGQTRSR